MTFLLAPFITDSDFKLSVTKNGEVEGLHALTYSEIIRVAVDDPISVMAKAFEWDGIRDRSKTILTLLNELKITGMRYVLGELDNNQELYNIAFKGLVTFYCLERIQFMASFSQTFALVETDNFQPIGELVKKIMKDEFKYHCRTMEYAIKHEMTTKRGGIAYMEVREDIEAILSEVVQREYDWNEVMFSKYNIPNMTLDQANRGVEYHAQEVYNTFYIEAPFKQQEENPLRFMTKYMTLDFFQNANQESDHSNYSLNSYHKDLEDTVIFNRY
jgi:ribonucleoside-diphosphate reductase beta chain